MLAITRLPPEHLHRCELTFVPRLSIDYEQALRQHADYCEMLTECGAEVITLSPLEGHPDCAFVEDTAVVPDEVAVMASMGTPSRQGEVESVASLLRQYRPAVAVEPPATLEGGDVLQIGRTLLVGLSRRTNRPGCEALVRIVWEYGYRVVPVPVHGCLHLKTACTAIDESTLLVNPAWIDTTALAGFSLLPVPPDEPWAANTLRIGDVICLSSAHARTAEILDRLGMRVRPVDITEFAKAEAGVTCLSLLIE